MEKIFNSVEFKICEGCEKEHMIPANKKKCLPCRIEELKKKKAGA